MRREPIANSPAPTRASAAGQRSPASSSCLTSIASSVHLVHGRLMAIDGQEGDQGQTQLRTAGRSAADSGSPHPCRTYGVAPPAKRPDSTALGHPSLIRMRPLVQVQPGPLHRVDLRERSSVVSSDRGRGDASPAHNAPRAHPCRRPAAGEDRPIATMERAAWGVGDLDLVRRPPVGGTWCSRAGQR